MDPFCVRALSRVVVGRPEKEACQAWEGRQGSRRVGTAAQEGTGPEGTPVGACRGGTARHSARQYGTLFNL